MIFSFAYFYTRLLSKQSFGEKRIPIRQLPDGNEMRKLLLECELLNEYIEEGRYPGDLPWELISEKNAGEVPIIGNAADKIARFVKGRIKFEK